MFEVIGYNGIENSKTSLGFHHAEHEAVVAAEGAYLVGNFDGAVVVDRDLNRQVYSVGDNT